MRIQTWLNVMVRKPKADCGLLENVRAEEDLYSIMLCNQSFAHHEEGHLPGGEGETFIGYLLYLAFLCYYSLLVCPLLSLAGFIGATGIHKSDGISELVFMQK